MKKLNMLREHTTRQARSGSVFLMVFLFALALLKADSARLEHGLQAFREGATTKPSSLGPMEVVLILAVAALFFGAKKIPELVTHWSRPTPKR